MTLVDAQVVSSRTGAIVASVDELFESDEPNAVLCYMQAGKMRSHPVEWNSVSVCCGNDGTALYLGEFGELVAWDGAQFVELGSIPGVVDIGPLRCIRYVQPGLYIASGTGLQAYSSPDGRNWTREQVAGADDELSLEAVAQLADETYAVGWAGAIWRRRGRAWDPVDSPTNLDLFALAAGCDGYMYACGDEGTILKGRADSWSVIEHDATKEKLWSVACFKGRTLFSGMQLLYELVGDQLELLAAPEDAPFPTSTYRLRVAGETLWSMGPKQLFEFDGAQWLPLLDAFDS